MADVRITRAVVAGAFDPEARAKTIFRVSFALAAAVLLVPLLMVDVPPIVDYPNHLARFFLLGPGHSDPILSRMYEPYWRVIPDLGFDLLAPWMMSVLPVHVVGRIVLALTLLVPVIGTIAYHRALYGGYSLWPLGSFLVAYNGLFLMGFENLLLSLGLALLAAAIYVRYERTNWILADGLMVPCAIVIFLMHIVGLAALIILVGSYKLEKILRLWPAYRAMVGQAIVQGCGLVLILAVPTRLYLSSSFSQAGGGVIWTAGPYKIKWLLGPLLNYYPTLDVASAAILIFLILIFAIAGKLRFSFPVCFASIVLILIYPYLPITSKGGSFLDVRIPIFLGFLVFCAFVPKKLPRAVALLSVVAVGSLFVARTAVVAAIWHSQQREVEDFRHTIEPIPPGSRVLTVIAPGPGKDMLTSFNSPSMYAGDPSFQPTAPMSRYLGLIGMPTYIHLGALVVIERRAFYPTVFADITQHPLRVVSPYDQISDPTGVPPSFLMLGLQTIPSMRLDQFPYLANWRRNFDYVLVLNASQAGDLRGFLPESLVCLRQTPIAALFRIRK